MQIEENFQIEAAKEIIGDYTHLGYRYQAIIKKRANGTIKPLIIDLPGNSNPEKIPYNY